MAHELYAGYEEEIREFRLDFSRGGAYTGIALVLLGAGLDYGLYPNETASASFIWRGRGEGSWIGPGRLWRSIA